MRICQRTGLRRPLSPPPNVTCCECSVVRPFHTSGLPTQPKAQPGAPYRRVRATTDMALDSKTRAQIVRSIKKLVLAHHINVGSVDYAAWTRRVDERTPELLSADLATFEAG